MVRSGAEQADLRASGLAGGDMTAAELRATTQRAAVTKNNQAVQEQKREEAKKIADAEFKRAQAEAKAEGRTVISQTSRVNVATGAYKSRTTTVDSASFRRPQDQSTSYEYVNPRHNQQFGSKRVGDIINDEVSKGDKGLYKPRQTYNNDEVKRFTSEYGKPIPGKTHHKVEINDSLSGYIPGKTHFKVELNDSLSNRGQAPQIKEKPAATGGFVEGLSGYAKNTKDDFELGFFGSGIGLGSLITGGKASKAQIDRIGVMGAEAEARTSRELERELVGAGINAGVSAYEGKTPSSKELSNLGADIAKNPSYFAGSAFGTAISFASPGSVAKITRGITQGIGIKGAAKTSETIAAQALKEFGIKNNKGDISIQAFKITKKGEEIPLSQRGGRFIESKVRSIPIQSQRLGIGSTVNIPGTSIALKIPEKLAIKTSKPVNPDLFMVSKGLDDVASFSLKNKSGGVFLSGASKSEKELLVGQKIIPSKKIQGIGYGLDIATPSVAKMKGARAPASGIVDIFQSEGKVLPKVGTFMRIRPGESSVSPIVKASEGIKVAGSRSLGFSVAEFSTKKMLDFASYGKKSALNKAELGLFGPQKTKYSPFQFADVKKPKLTQSSRTPLETQNEFDFDRTIMRSALKDIALSGGKQASSKTSDLAPGLARLGLGGNAKNYTAQGPLGFGGATGAERKRSNVQDDDFGIGYDFLQTPKGKGISRLDSRSITSTSKNDFSSKADSLSGLRMDNFSLTGRASKTSSKNDIFSLPKSDKISLSRAISAEGFGFKGDSTTSQTTRTTNIFRLETPTVTRFDNPMRRFRFPDIPDFGGKTSRKGKKGKKGSAQKRTFQTTDPLASVLGPRSKLGRRVQNISDMFS